MSGTAASVRPAASAIVQAVGRRFEYPPKPVPGDRVAVLSPSGRSAARFSAPFELGLSRLRGELELVPVEYPTTRAPQASPEERARDVHAAFADPEIRVVIASIGGEDELKVLAHLDGDALAADPKPFFGYSDNTNLHLFLWNVGLVSYHGCAVMVQLARPGSMHPHTLSSLRRALFTRGTYTLEPAPETTDEEGDWNDPESLGDEPVMIPSDGWSWHGPQARVRGPGWGGSLEIVDFHLRASRYLAEPDAYDGAVAYLETSEELPPASYVYRVLMGMGERGLLSRFAALLWGRPKAWSHEHPNGPDEKARYVAAQREAVLAAVEEYNPRLPVVWGVELGHTDPQVVVPSGGEITVDAVNREIAVTY
jgi:muramoyltetrapeptide carboxypeptidase LdcA involved in peptidoglycan recycling